MNIGFAVRSDFLTRMGGDSVQLLNTKKYLEDDFGVQCTIITSVDDVRNESLDVLHIFNMQPQTVDDGLKYAEMARKLNIKVALSPIYWRLDESFIIGAFSRRGLIDVSRKVVTPTSILLRSILRHLPTKKGFFSRDSYQKANKLLSYANIILPNSPEEKQILQETFPSVLNLDSKWAVVPNSVDKEKFSQQKNFSRDLPKKLEVISSLSGKYILCAARIEPLKNQLRILKALKKYPDLPVVFVGSDKGDAKYNSAVKKYAEKRGNTFFIGEVSQEEMAFVYSNAAVHVLPSFQESSGLASIESLFCGTPIVTSSAYFCPVKFYKFDEYGYQCNPYKIASITESISSALSQSKPKISDDYRSFFSYRNAALHTYEAYKEIV
ncbi:glycosyltransferase family 4 protein [Lacticaseibacillus paracasei]|uniref:glycosyltransferase family 4 protein n=1 Tax=Lacticaseibacillus paracasei TaxID=1597 RepID=UPI0025A0819E|nr:glycosyltransferase family 4 protein [Lacticaseibacillus paracasei]MDM7532900.1 glycosyltransferase family 4 protein [Lacticaseibacillus paracasei]